MVIRTCIKKLCDAARMWWLAPAVLLMQAVCVSFGQANDERLQTLLDRVPLPAAYRAKALRYLDDEQDPSMEFQVWMARDWSVGLQSIAQPGLGFVPLDYSYSTRQESWRYSFTGRRAERTNIFAERHHAPMESQVSPINVIRRLKAGGADVLEVVSGQDGTTKAILANRGNKFTTHLLFDDATGALKAEQTVSPAGEVQMEYRFEDWRTFPSGASAPYQVYVAAKGVRTDDPGWQATMLLTEVEEIDSASPPARLPLSSEFTIVDEIEGVSKRADGSVLGPIERQTQPTGINRNPPPGAIGLGSRTVMLIGVGLILLAGIVFGVRRWKGA